MANGNGEKMTAKGAFWSMMGPIFAGLIGIVLILLLNSAKETNSTDHNRLETGINQLDETKVDKEIYEIQQEYIIQQLSEIKKAVDK